MSSWSMPGAATTVFRASGRMYEYRLLYNWFHPLLRPIRHSVAREWHGQWTVEVECEAKSLVASVRLSD